jgi:prepilin-type N-terminal cleavage/methylation domain-containing protein
MSYATIMPMRKTISGFTIVELLIVIVVIAILAAISIVAYNGIQERARFSAMRSDLSSLNKAIQLYYADNGTYPITPTSTSYCSGNWCGWDQGTNDNFIPGLAPKYITSTPQLSAANANGDTYLYRSPDGTAYKLIRLLSPLPANEASAMADLMTTNCSAAINSSRWGYWSSPASQCW